MIGGKSSYRPDIDGLRAIAVLAIVLFHFFPSLVSGGFIGVDIFFVISGYLISNIILGGHNEGRFSLKKFYARRIRRIFPALIVILVVVLGAGYVLLFPYELFVLGKHVLAGSIFVSNFVLWKESGYFDSAAELKPLLHLWSLSVEEQFYIFWPLFLGTIWKKFRSSLLLAVLTLAVGSFVLSIVAIYYRPVAAFYLPFTRVWELLLGCVLACVTQCEILSFKAQSGKEREGAVRLHFFRNKERYACFGIFLIFLSLILLDKSSLFPGYWVLLPTLGAVAIIAAGEEAYLNRAILGNRILVFIGIISFPLYLWHWPLITFARIVIGPDLGYLVRTLLLFASVLLAWLTFLLVESPIRFSGEKKLNSTAAGLLAAIVSCGLVGSLISKSLVEGRLSDQRILRVSHAVGDWHYPVGEQVKVGTGVPEVIFIGDSHMEHYWPRVQFLNESGKIDKTALFFTYGGCLPLPDLTRVGKSYNCAEIYDEGMKRAMQENIKKVVVGGWWEYYFSNRLLYSIHDPEKSELPFDSPYVRESIAKFRKTIQLLVQRGKVVYIILSSPTSGAFSPENYLPNRMDLAYKTVATGIDKSQFSKEVEFINAELRDIANETGAIIVDPLQYLCNKDICPGLDPDGTPIYKDTNHLTHSSSRKNATFMDQIFQ